MNLNQLAKTLSMLEGKKKKIDIAQIKEILACMGTIFSNLPDDGRDLRKKLVAAARKRNTRRGLQAKKTRAKPSTSCKK